MLTPPKFTKKTNYTSFQMFGSSSKPQKIGVDVSAEIDHDEAAPPSPSPSPTIGFKKEHRRVRQSSRASILSALCDSGTPIPREAMRSLGLTGTLGGPEPEVNPDELDSDIRYELQDILSGQSHQGSTRAYDETWSVKSRSAPPSPGEPPEVPLPQLRARSFEDLPVTAS